MVRVQGRFGFPPRAVGEVGAGECDVRRCGGPVGRHPGRGVSVEDLHWAVNACIRYLLSSFCCPGVRGVGVPCGIVCVEVPRDQGVVYGREKGNQVGCVAWLAGAGGRNIDIDDPELGSLNLDHNGLVLEVWVSGEQGVNVDLPVSDGVVDQCDESTTPSGCAVFAECGVVLERFECVVGLKFGFLDAGNQDLFGVEEVL